MTESSATVSLLWLAPPGDRLAESWSSVSASCAGVAEATLIGPAVLHPTLELLPRAFARQSVVTWDADALPAALNRAVAAGRSEFILLITGAMSGATGWLEQLRQPLDSHAAAAVAAPQLVGEDGRIAAAGGVVWADGTCDAFGAGGGAASHESAFRRTVTVVLPQCLLIRATSLRDVGGFQTGYRTPAYTVADACFSLRARGLRVEYQPRASVQADAAQNPSLEDVEGDRARFTARWPNELADLPHRPDSTPSPRRWLLARDAVAGERILVVDDRVVGPDRGSGDPRMFTMLREMVALWPSLRVTLAAMTELGAARNAQRLQDSGIEVAHGQNWPRWFHERSCHYGIVIMSRPQAPDVDRWIRSTQPQAFRIYDAEALVFRRLERMLPLVSDARRIDLRDEIRAVRSREIEYIAAADEILCVSHQEQRIARAMAAPDTPVFVIPFCVDVAKSPPGFDERRDLVYFGGFMAGPGSPNEDAVLHLVNDVLPLIRQRAPDVVLHVVGADPTPAVLALESAHVHVVGYVDDPRTWLDRVRLHLVPMRFGAGLKQKLVDTMAAGLPFVATPVAAEGLRLGSLARFTVAETSEELAELTLALYLDANHWAATQHRILRLAPRHGRQRFRRVLSNAMAGAGIAPPRGPGGRAATAASR